MITFGRIEHEAEVDTFLMYRKVEVFLENKWVGTIYENSEGWYYKPKGTKIKGDTFPTLKECKLSLIGDD